MPSYGGGRSLPTGGYAPNTRPGQNQRDAGYALQQQMQPKQQSWVDRILGRLRNQGALGSRRRQEGPANVPSGYTGATLMGGAANPQASPATATPQIASPEPPPQGEAPNPWRYIPVTNPGGVVSGRPPAETPQTGGNTWEGGSAGQPPSWGAGNPWMPQQKPASREQQPAFQPYNPGFPKPPKPTGGGWAGGEDPFGAVTNNYGG